MKRNVLMSAKSPYSVNFLLNLGLTKIGKARSRGL
jgi:hypothetical protein